MKRVWILSFEAPISIARTTQHIQTRKKCHSGHLSMSTPDYKTSYGRQDSRDSHPSCWITTPAISSSQPRAESPTPSSACRTSAHSSSTCNSIISGSLPIHFVTRHGAEAGSDREITTCRQPCPTTTTTTTTVPTFCQEPPLYARSLIFYRA